MARRQQVELGLQEPQITPAAAPVNTYYRPQIPAPLMKQIIELAPLSDTLSKISDAEQKKQAQKDLTAGKQLYQSLSPDKLTALGEATAALDKAEKGRTDNQKQWASLVAKGVVPESASPWTRVGFFETASADLMNGYHARLMSRLDEVSAAVDAQGNPVAPGDPQRIIAEEWDKISKHPIFQDFYGGRVAADMKQKIDMEVSSRALDAQGQAQVEFRRAQIVNNLSSVLGGWAPSGDPWTPDKYEQLRVLADKQMHGRSMKDVSGAFMDAVQFVAANENVTNPQGAVAFLKNAANIPSGTTTLGEDARTGTKIATLRKQYEAEAETREERDRTQRINRENDAVRDAVTAGLQVMSLADARGESPVTAINTFITEAQVKNSYGPLTGRVIASLQEVATAKADQSEPGLSESLHRRAALGDLTGMVEEAQMLLKSGKLSVKDYNGVVSDVKTRTDVTPILEGNDAFVAQRMSLSRAMSSTNVPVELRGSLDQLAADKEASFTEDASAFAKTVVGQPDAKDQVRTWAMERAAKDKVEYAAQENKITEQRNMMTKDIRAKLQRHEPAESEIEAARTAGVITLSEAGDFGAQSSLFSDWSWYRSRPEYTAAESDIQAAAAQATIDNFGKPGEAQAQLGDMLTLSRRMLSDKYSEWLSTELPGLSANEIAGKSRAALRVIADEVVKDLGNAARERAKKLIAGGKGVSEAVVEGQEEPKGAPSKYEATLAAFTSAGREGFVQILDAGRSAVVDTSVYSKLDGLTKDSWFHARRPGVEDAVLAEAKRLSAAGLDPIETQRAMHSMAKDLVAPWRDVLDGKLTFFPSNERIAYENQQLGMALVRVEAEAVRAGLKTRKGGLAEDSGQTALKTTAGDLEELAKKAIPGSALDQAVSLARGQMSLNERRLAVSVPFDATMLDPLTTPFFRSQVELDQFAADGRITETSAALLSTLGLPATQAGLDRFYKAQTLAVLRTNPDAPKTTKEKTK